VLGASLTELSAALEARKFSSLELTRAFLGRIDALNGALNLSIRDGWWDEWFDGENGWAIPSAEGVEDVDHRDDLEAAALYDLIENEVAPRFYDVDENFIPKRWVELMRHTLTSLGPKVQATRMVREYVDTLYRPAAHSGRQLNSDYDGAMKLAEWKQRVRAGWSDVTIEHVDSGAAEVFEMGERLRLRVFVSLGSLSADDVDVQVVHGQVDESDRLREPEVTSLVVTESYEPGRHRFEGEVRLDHTGAFGYTIRVVPRHELLAGGAELGLATLAG
jgi:glycogen phosphorylase